MTAKKRRKATVPYVVGGTKITLGVLSQGATVIHPPCVSLVIDLATQVITVVEGAKDNRDNSRALIERLLGLLLVLSEAHRGKTDEQLAPDIRKSLKRLTSQLDTIREEIEKMQESAGRRSFMTVLKEGLLYVDNGKKIKDCITRIDWAMDVFQVEGRIGSDLRLQDVHTDVMLIRERLMRQDTLAHVNYLGAFSDAPVHDSKLRTQDHEPYAFGSLPCVIESTADGIGPLRLLFSPSILPSKPQVLYGRDRWIDKIVDRMTTSASPRYAILGPGGIGKTALSLGVMDHRDVVERFGDSRFFVRCEEATSAALLIELIARGLGIEELSRDRMEDVTSRLRGAIKPILLVLDNFETPWDIVNEQSRVEDILYQITSFPHVAILVTMRSNAPPSIRIPWSLPWLEPLSILSIRAARQLYISIDPNARRDASLNALLSDLSYMPLAITLVASLGRTGETPTALLRAWRDMAVGTDLIVGSDKTKSVTVSIRLSVESNRMRSVPGAVALLSVIAMLPGGADPTLLPKLAPSISNLVACKAMLHEVALTQTDHGSATIQLLSPIRSYVLKHHPVSENVKKAVYEAYVQYVTDYTSAKRGPSSTQALAAEETNLEAILPLAIQSISHPALEAAMAFSHYQLYTRPRLEVITSVIDVCEQNNIPNLLACSLAMFGDISHLLNRYDEAQLAFEKASIHYYEPGGKFGLAYCLGRLGEIHRFQGRSDDSRLAYNRASDMYEELGDRLGAASCLTGLGDLHRDQEQYEEAQENYDEALDIYQELHNWRGVANCLLSLGAIHRLQGCYDDAQAAWEQASSVYGEFGDKIGVANCLFNFGDVHRLQGLYGEAQASFEQASDMLYRHQKRYEEAYTAYVRASHMHGELGDRLGTANCLSGLGDLHGDQERYEEAQKEYDQALGIYRELRHWRGVANCLHSLGAIPHLLQSRYTQVLPKSKKEVGLGRAIINKKAKDAKNRNESQRYTTDIVRENANRMQSVTQENDLDEFLNTAQLADADFTAEKQNVRIVHAPTSAFSINQNPFLLSTQDEKDALRKQWEHRTHLRVPRRPPWKKTMTPAQIDRQEREAILDWRRNLAHLQERENLLLTPFERNLEVWRQLWRVLERSHLIVQIVDARNPLRFRCEDLEAYVQDVEGPEGEQGTGKGFRNSLLLINKSDLLSLEQRRQWADYFDGQGIQYAFFSALDAKALQEAKRMAAEAQSTGESLTVEQAREKIRREEEESENEADRSYDAGAKNEATQDSLEENSDPLALNEQSSSSGSEDDNDESDGAGSDGSEEERSHILRPRDANEEARTRVLTVLELEELFNRRAPDLTKFADRSTGVPPRKLVVGLVGYPNVGKSSTINALLDEKVVSVSSTPGKTKHFQTIHLSSSIMLCDCPGLVFPQFATTKAELICDGVLPIDQMKEYTGPSTLLCQRIPPEILEATYGLKIRRRTEEEGGDGKTIIESDFLSAYAVARGFARAGVGNPDEARAARYILKDYVDGKLLFCHPPPDVQPDAFNVAEQAEILKRLQASGKKMAPTTRVTKNAVTSSFEPASTSTSQSNLDSPPTPPADSAKTRALDKDFFDNQAVSSRPFVQGSARNGMQVSRNMRYPHENAAADDGSTIDAQQARMLAALNAAKGGKKHFKQKRVKLRTGNPAVGYD
ncbi:hypothetical protein FRB98_005287 [Tulasnella sp. 332]|nr:hypothetical protein FRB98_005287 [Tulasnella sp. 332]